MNTCVSFQSARYPPTAVAVAINVRRIRPGRKVELVHDRIEVIVAAQTWVWAWAALRWTGSVGMVEEGDTEDAGWSSLADLLKFTHRQAQRL